MTDDDKDDFGFDDDDLDLLPAHALHSLEANAWKATQQRQQQRPADSDYGLDDGDEVVNLDDGDEVVDLDERHGTASFTSQPRPSQNVDAARLLSRIRQLELDKAREKRQADDLRGKLQTKAGEADTLRRRHDADSRRYERQMADQAQQHSSEVLRFKAEIERLRRDKEQAQTDTMFDQHDAREAGMAQRTRRAAAMPTRTKSAARAPKGDGFDDDDVVMMSPSKPRDRAKTATPKHPAKRKRQLTDQSPIPLPALQLSAPRSRPKEKDLQEPVITRHAIDAQLLDLLRRDDRRFDLLHRLLSYPCSNGTDRVLENLSQFAFPSQPSKKLSSILYDALATAHLTNTLELALFICRQFLDLWKKCLDERYYAPIRLILDALQFVFVNESAKLVVELLQPTVTMLISTVDLVALPVSNAAKLGEKAIANLFSATQRDVASKVDVQDCLELLYMIATSCSSPAHKDARQRLWQAIPSSFAIMLLNKEFPQNQIMLMLRILATSALSSTVGPIAPEDEGQANVEDALINRLTNILTEIPKSISDPVATTSATQASESEIWNLRLVVIMILTQFSISEHGCARLAQNRICTGRLIKYLDTTITSLYRQPLSPTQDQKVQTINATMKLIYHISTSSPGFDIKSKLANTMGGQHAYLVALTRLAFSEGLMLEAGIEDAVVDMAHSILDEGLSPQEGDAFGMVFSSGNSI